MTNNETVPAATPRAKKAKAGRPESTSALSAEPTPVTATTPAAPVAYPNRGVGRGILIGGIAAALVGGLAIGGAGGFAIATAADHGEHGEHMTFAGPGGQVPQGQGGMPGPLQGGGMPDGGQGGVPGGPNGPQGQNPPQFQNGQGQNGPTQTQPGQTQPGQTHGGTTEGGTSGND